VIDPEEQAALAAGGDGGLGEQGEGDAGGYRVMVQVQHAVWGDSFPLLFLGAGDALGSQAPISLNVKRLLGGSKRSGSSTLRLNLSRNPSPSSFVTF